MAIEPTNLQMHREGPSVWDTQAQQNSRDRFLGAAGCLLIGAGIALVARAYRGQVATAVKGKVNSMMETRRKDDVSSASSESFPASDPPSWTPTVGKPAEAERR